MAQVNHRYTVYGLTMVSELELPELSGGAPWPAGRATDIRVVGGIVPDTPLGGIPVGPSVYIAGDRFFLRIAGVGRFLFTGGQEAVVDPDPGVGPIRPRAFLLASGLGALVHQRGLLPLHASVIEVNDGCVAFVGHAGAGKSTLAAELMTRGYRMVSDDVAVIDNAAVAELPLMVQPGVPASRLWGDAVARLGLSPENLVRVSPETEKYLVPWPGSFCPEPRELRAIVVLGDTGPGPNREWISGAAAFATVLSHVYRYPYVQPMGRAAQVFTAVAAVAARVPVVALGTTTGPRTPDGVATAALAALSPVLGSPCPYATTAGAAPL